MVDFPSRIRVPYGDVAALAETVRPIITPWYAGWIYIYDPNQNTGTGVDIDTGILDIVVHPYWGGKARIQPMRTNLLSKETTNDTTTRVVEFQVGYAKDKTLPDVAPGHQIIVMNGGNNNLLKVYQYTVTGMLNSTSAFNNTIFSQVNLETRANYTDVSPLDGVDIYAGCDDCG